MGRCMYCGQEFETLNENNLCEKCEKEIEESGNTIPYKEHVDEAVRKPKVRKERSICLVLAIVFLIMQLMAWAGSGISSYFSFTTISDIISTIAGNFLIIISIISFIMFLKLKK